MVKKQIVVIISVIILLGVIAGCNASSTSSDGDFPQNDVRIVVPYGPGGGNDLQARRIATFLEKHLPNDVSVFVDNVAGGEGNIGLSEVYRSDPDGYTLGWTALPGNFVNQVLGEANYDLTEVDYIGYAGNDSYLAAASHQSGYTKLEDLQQADEVIAGIGFISSTDGLGVLVASEHLGINSRTISHEGSPEIVLSAIRGDVNWLQIPFESLRASVIDSDDLVPLWVYAEERHPDLPDTPTIVELGHEELLNTVSLHRSVFTAPGTPPEILDILRTAFDAAVNDPEFIAQIEESGGVWSADTYERAKEVAEGSLEQIKDFEGILRDNR